MPGANVVTAVWSEDPAAGVERVDRARVPEDPPAAVKREDTIVASVHIKQLTRRIDAQAARVSDARGLLLAERAQRDACGIEREDRSVTVTIRTARTGNDDLRHSADNATKSALRKCWLAGTLTEERFAAAVGDLEDLDLDRYPALPLMRRVIELRANLTAYNATCVALAETLGRELLAGDGRLAGVPGLDCPIKVLS